MVKSSGLKAINRLFELFIEDKKKNTCSLLTFFLLIFDSILETRRLSCDHQYNMLYPQTNFIPWLPIFYIKPWAYLGNMCYALLSTITFSIPHFMTWRESRVQFSFLDDNVLVSLPSNVTRNLGWLEEWDMKIKETTSKSLITALSRAKGWASQEFFGETKKAQTVKNTLISFILLLSYNLKYTQSICQLATNEINILCLERL